MTGDSGVSVLVVPAAAAVIAAAVVVAAVIFAFYGRRLCLVAEELCEVVSKSTSYCCFSLFASNWVYTCYLETKRQ